jgi:uncharacterized cupredoxin-like copper-binding protein
VKLPARVALMTLVPALAACASAAAGGEQRVDVTIEHSAFVPARFDFPAGTTVRFVIHNDDPIDHEFIVGDEAVQRRHEDGTEPQHGKVPGEVSVPAGATRATTYTFSESGTLIVGCHLPGHYDYGMRAPVTVDS